MLSGLLLLASRHNAFGALSPNSLGADAGSSHVLQGTGELSLLSKPRASPVLAPAPHPRPRRGPGKHLAHGLGPKWPLARWKPRPKPALAVTPALDNSEPQALSRDLV